MNRLPPELLSYIISFLPVNEILKCKQINSEWRSIIDNNIRLKNLVITYLNLAFEKWSFTNQLVNCYDWIKQFYSTDDELIFKNLNQLYISGDYSFEFIGQLNALNQLKRLEINHLYVEQKNFILNLPNLTHLALRSVCLNHPITLNTPNLSNFRTDFDFDQMIISHPSSIKILELYHYDSKVMKLSNLEYLYCEEIKNIDENFLIKMPNLKEIHFIQNDVFHSLKRQTKELKRDLKFYYFGINLVALPYNKLDLDEYDETTIFLCRNYDKLAETVPFIHSINYDVLDYYRFDSIPIDFTSKFVDLKTVKVEDKLINKKQFIEFLKGYRNLKELILKNSSLNQSFINILPDLLPNLEDLTICDKKIIFNFEPILKFKELCYFGTHQNFEDLVLLYNLLKKKWINQLYIYYSDKHLNLSSSKDNFSIRGYRQEEKIVFSSDDNFYEKFEEFQQSNIWKCLPLEFESDEEMDTDYEPDDESIYELAEIHSNELNVINQSSSSNDESETN